MTVPVVLNQNDLLVHPGNDFTGPTWAILSRTGGAFDLGGWDPRMQVRTGTLDPTVFQEFTIDRGLIVDEITLVSPVTDQEVTTGSVQLVLSRDDTASWPQLWVGWYDVQIYKSDTPPQQYTIVPTARLYVVGGPTWP